MTNRFSKDQVFQAVKYLVYILIFMNVLYFMREDYLASTHTAGAGLTWASLGAIFASSIDSIAWFVLMIIFEFETYILDDEKMKGSVQWLLNGLAAICYGLIFYAFYGYLGKFLTMTAFMPSTIATACEHVGPFLSSAHFLDDYYTLTLENCTALTGPFVVNEQISMVVSETMHKTLMQLSFVDVLNSGAWIGIIIILQVDIMLQIRGKLTPHIYRLTLIFKAILYLLLFVAAFFWGFLGDGIGFWDAILWIFAFFFIELNLLKWNEEDQDKNNPREQPA